MATGLLVATTLIWPVSSHAHGRSVYPIHAHNGPPSSLSVIFPQHPRSAEGGVPTVVKVRYRALASSDRRAYRAHALGGPVVVDRAAAHTAAAGALSVGPGFPGLADNGYYPADAELAVGPDQVVEMTNTMVGVYTRNGVRINMFDMSQILAPSSNDSMSDPQIAWDATSQRWIAAGMDLTTNATDVAISDTADPDGTWESYSFSFGSSACPDQPRLGFSSAVVIVATELFNGACHKRVAHAEGGVMLVIDKQAMMAGAENVATSEWGPSLVYNDYVPVQMLAPSTTDYITASNLGISTAVHVLESQGLPPNDTIAEQDSLLIQPLQDPGTNASERDGNLIDAGDDRINDATWAGNMLYLVADDRCTYHGDRYLETCARVMEISTAGGQPTLVGENDIGWRSADAYYAAIRPDSHGNAIIAFDYSGPHTWPSVAVVAAVGPIQGEQGGTFTNAINLALGTGPTVERWGDYSGAAIDPTNPDVIWVAGQIADDFGDLSRDGPARWASHIDAVSLSSALSALPAEVYPGVIYHGRTGQGERIQIRPSGGAHIYGVWATVRMPCQRGGHDTLTFQLPNETRRPVTHAGRFQTSARWGADRYAYGYSVSISGRFRNGYSVTGTLRGSEQDRTYGRCTSGRVRYSAHT
jgi:hypothetical protein